MIWFQPSRGDFFRWCWGVMVVMHLFFLCSVNSVHAQYYAQSSGYPHQTAGFVGALQINFMRRFGFLTWLSPLEVRLCYLTVLSAVGTARQPMILA